MRVPVPGRRSTTQETPSGLVIVIPANRHIPTILGLTAWLVGWAAGAYFAAREVYTQPVGFVTVFLSAWLAGWTFGGLWAAYFILWLAFGHEIVTLRAGTLTLKRDVFGLGRLLEYDVGSIRGLRVEPQPADPSERRSGYGPWGTVSGTVAFDYGSSTIRFGAVDDAEGQQIIAELKTRHSFSEGAT